MTSRTLTVGAVQVTAVCDVVAAFPDPLADAFPASRRRPGRPSGGATRRRSTAPTAGGCMSGASWSGPAGGSCWSTPGSAGPGRQAGWIGTPGRLPEELAAAGTDVDEVDLVVLTHLHLDHVGWNLTWDGGSPRPRFPRDNYLVQRADWEAFAARPEATRVAFDRCVRPLADLGVAELLDGDRILDPVLSVLHTPGHTPGSQSLLVRSGAAAVLLWGDVANHPAQVDRPDWGPASDALPEVARQTRRRLLDRLEAEAMWLAPSHFPEPFGTVTRGPDGRYWTGRR